MPTLSHNKKAKFDYELLEKYEAGLVLLGHEVKSIRSGNANINNAYISIRTKGKSTELFLIGANIPLYNLANPNTEYKPDRDRKLLLNKLEISSLLGKTQIKGLTLIPLKIYTKRGLIKLEFALAKGRKKYDKRELIKKRDLDRQIRTLTKKSFI